MSVEYVTLDETYGWTTAREDAVKYRHRTDAERVLLGLPRCEGEQDRRQIRRHESGGWLIQERWRGLTWYWSLQESQA